MAVGPVEGETAQHWFDRQPYDTKVGLISAPLYEAYRDGNVRWEEIFPEGFTSLQPTLVDKQALNIDMNAYTQKAREIQALREVDPILFEIRDDLDRIVPVLSKLTGRASRWNRQARLTGDFQPSGAKPPSCEIQIRQDIAASPLRWRTLIHEALHALSEGLNRDSYGLFLGWEEGVIEQLQRLLRPEVLRWLNVSVPEEVWQAIETEHPYNTYIAVLEELRTLLGEESRTFYLDLLAVPLATRAAYLRHRGQNLSGDAAVRFEQRLIQSFGTLRLRRL